MNPTLLTALTSHTPALVVGAVLCLLVLSAKLPAFASQWQRIPAAYRPLVPIVVGILSGVAEALTTRQSWVAALVTQAH